MRVDHRVPDSHDLVYSVVLPVRNGMPYLVASVQSVLSQTLERFELLVVDDGSTDETPQYVRSLADPRVRYMQTTHSGLVGALNTGVRAARASWIARIDADDLAMPDRLERQWSWLQTHGEQVLLGCGFDLIDEQGQRLKSALNVVSDAAARWAMLFFNPFPHPGAVFRRDVAQQCGGYRNEVPVAQDFDLWTRMADHGQIGNHPDTLCHKRSTSQSITTTANARQHHFAEQVLRRYAATYVPQVDSNDLVELRRWYVTGDRPTLTRAEQLAATFARCCAHVKNVPDRYLHATVKHVQGTLCYRCQQATRATLCDFRQAWRWLKLTRCFAPFAPAPSQQVAQRLWRSLRHGGVL
jgi:glycosyltransferase involved in cell wall biosynthesis